MNLIDRSPDLTSLYDKVMAREHLFLHGATGMGKTHLIHRLRDKLQGRRVCFYYSLRGITAVKPFISLFVKEMQQTAKNHHNLEYQLRRFLEEQPAHHISSFQETDRWLKKLVTVLENISLDFLFIFEDLHEWEQEENDLKTLFTTLKEGKNHQLLLTANRPLKSFDASDLHYRELLPVPREEIWSSPGGQQEQAYAFTAGNTGFLTEMLNHMESGCTFEEAREKLMQHYHPVLNKMRNRFTLLQWKLFRSIAFEEAVEQPHAFEFLVKYQLGAASSVERALGNLADTQMIVKTPEGWIVTNIIYRRWLQWLYLPSAWI